MTNLPTAADIKRHLDALVEELKALEASSIDDAGLVPLSKSIRDVAAYAATIHAQIELRAISNNVLLPGVVVKDAVTHRKWNDAELAAELAYTQFGLKAFKLESPAALEKLGDEGKALVAVASFKPPAGKRVEY